MSKQYDEIVAKDNALICSTYGRYPIAISHGKGSRLYDVDGNEYIDLLSGLAVTSLGHSRDDLARIMAEQATRMVHVSNLFYQKPQLELAEKLLSTCEADKVFFANSGAEANEGAIKLVRRYMSTVRKSERYEIITLEGSFHGRTLATLTATGQFGPIRDGFAPFPEGFRTAPFNDVAGLRAAVTEKTAAIMIEIVQGEGGVRPLSAEFIDEVKRLRTEHGLLVVVDEIQTGLCRTGKFWAHQMFDLIPDIFTTAKALANGLPMGAVFATDKVAEGFAPGSHATTFGGGGVLSAVASKVVDIMLEENMADRAAELGKLALDRANALSAKHSGKIASVRAVGCMIGIELTEDGRSVWQKLMDRRFILNLTQGTVLRLLPALTTDKEDLESFFEALDEILELEG